MKDTQVLLYTSYLHQIGGIETFVLNFIEHLHNHYDITLMSERMPDDMVVRISKWCRVIDRAELGEIKTAGFSCDVLVMIRLTDEIPSFVTYDKSIRMCHASKIPEGYAPRFDCDEMVPVSEAANDCLGRPDNATVIHNLLKTDARKSLLLVSATRLPAQDKGIDQAAQQENDAGDSGQTHARTSSLNQTSGRLKPPAPCTISQPHHNKSGGIVQAPLISGGASGGRFPRSRSSRRRRSPGAGRRRWRR